jgi:FkbM family methyltransferase
VFGLRRRASLAMAAISRWRSRRAARRFYGQFIKRGDLCFDIGANLGNRTEVFMELGAKVVAVEPQTDLAEKLRSRFEPSGRVTVVRAALGETEGQAELLLCSAHTLASLSANWVQRMRASGRFARYAWDKSQTVTVTTLDKLVRQHGLPRFCKIDVEGFELQVIRGLSQATPCLSFEFVPEALDLAEASVKHLDALGAREYNYSLGESMTLRLPNWVAGRTLLRLLAALPDKGVFGDIYGRIPSAAKVMA